MLKLTFSKLLLLALFYVKLIFGKISAAISVILFVVCVAIFSGDENGIQVHGCDIEGTIF